MTNASKPIQTWLKQKPDSFVRAFVRAWRIAGISVFRMDSSVILKIGRAAARFDKKTLRIETTEFLHVSPDSGHINLHAASWDTRGGAIFHDDGITGIPHSLDGRGMKSALGGWIDFLDAIRIELKEAGDRNFIEFHEGISVIPLGTAPIKVKLREDVANEIRSLLDRYWEVSASRALHEWKSHLSPADLTAMERARLNHPGAWNWLAGRERRIQAVSFAPWAVQHMMDKGWGSRIDSGLPMMNALTREYGIPEYLVRRMSNMPRPSFSLHEWLQNLTMIPHAAHYPTTREGWRCLQSLRQHGASREEITHLCSQAEQNEWDSIADEMSDISQDYHLMRDMHIRVVMPHLVAANPSWNENTAFRHSVLRSPTSLLHFLRRHVSRGREDEEEIMAARPVGFPQNASHDFWTKLHEDWTSRNGIVVTCLNTPALLVREGALMSHCVADYKQNCLITPTHILSMRMPGEERPLATIEVDLNALVPHLNTSQEPFTPQPTLPPWVRQFKSFKNQSPSWVAYIALWEWASDLRTGMLRINTEGLNEDLNMRRKSILSNVRISKSSIPEVRAILRLYSKEFGKGLKRMLEQHIRGGQ